MLELIDKVFGSLDIVFWKVKIKSFTWKLTTEMASPAFFILAFFNDQNLWKLWEQSFSF